MLSVLILIPFLAQSTPRVGVGSGERKLPVAEAIEMALANNLDIEIERANVANATQAIRAAQGAFDPSFRWLPSVETRNTPTASVLQGANGKLTEHFHTENFSLREKTPWQGASFGLDFNNQRYSSTNIFSSLNPYYNSQLVLSYNQPLWRNRVIDRDRATIQIRRKNFDVSEADFETRVIDVVTRVQQAYWDLVAARQDVQVTADAVQLAQKQLEMNERMIQAGTLAPVEISASRAELERRRDTYFAAVGTVTEVENNLKTLIAPSRTASIWAEALLPVDEKSSAAQEEALNDAVNAAVKRRPEVRSVNLRQQANDIEKRLNADQIRPQMNFVASYTNSGLGGAVRPGDNPFTASNAALYDRVNALSTLVGLPPVAQASFGSLPRSILGGYGTALSGVFGGNYPGLQMGVQVDLTLRNRAAQSQYAQSAIAEKRLKLEQSRLEQLIEAEVRNALQGIQTARQRIAAAQASLSAAQEKLESETRLFQTGESTNFLVLTRQNEYLDSRRRAVVAQLELNRATARLEQAVGSTLAAHAVKVK